MLGIILMLHGMTRLPDHKGEVRYQYFLQSDRQLSQDHIWDYMKFPVMTSEKYREMQRNDKNAKWAI